MSTTRRTGTKPNNTLQDLKGLVKELTVPARKELFDYLLMLQRDARPTPDQDRKLSMWCDSLNFELGNMLGQPQRIFPPAYLPQAKKLLQDVGEFMVSSDLGNLKTEELKMMYNLLAKILVNHAHIISIRVRIPLSMKVVVQTTVPIVSLFDNHFPGYIKAKLIKQVLLAGKKGTQHDSEED